MPGFERDVVVMGGCGHVGLPLGLAFAAQGLSVTLYDRNEAAVATVNGGGVPFREAGAEQLLQETLQSGRLVATTDCSALSRAEHVIVVIGTPMDRYLNPDITLVPRAVGEVMHALTPGQLLVLRSTVYPGVTAQVEKQLRARDLHVDVCFCPERIAEGRALEELRSLPQIVAGRTPRAAERAKTLFAAIADEVIELTPEEAELAKLFTNTWRYIKFAAANQLFMMANDHGLDYERIRHAVTYKYPRAADMPGPGLAAGPCLFKDTMQLVAFHRNSFSVGHASVLINEGLPQYIVDRLALRYELESLSVALLGMAFKPGSDDRRESLSYKLKRLLTVRARRVLCTDPYVSDDSALVSLDEACNAADLIIIATPHRDYADLQTDKPVVDVTNLLRQGVRI